MSYLFRREENKLTIKKAQLARLLSRKGLGPSLAKDIDTCEQQKACLIMNVSKLSSAVKATKSKMEGVCADVNRNFIGLIDLSSKLEFLKFGGNFCEPFHLSFMCTVSRLMFVLFKITVIIFKESFLQFRNSKQALNFR